ncbi:MAG: phage head closure protein [Thalassobaculum sp.]
MVAARAGDLTERVTFQRQVRVDDGGGGTEVTWQNVVTVDAQVRPLSGRERLQADQLQASANYRMTIRRRTDLDESMRVVWTGQADPMQIRFIGREGPREPFMLVDCEAGVVT